MVVVVSGSGTTGVGRLEGTVVVIVGSGEGETKVGRLSRIVVVVWKKCRVDSSSGGCCNMRRLNSNRIIGMDTIGRIGRYDSSSCCCQ